MTHVSGATRASAYGAALGLALLTLAPSAADACACGCGIFDIGDIGLAPNASPSGFTAWFRYSTMNQNQNWERGGRGPAADNRDKSIETSFYTLGGEYMINRKWSVMAELPIYDRIFHSTDDGDVAGPDGSLYRARVTSLGDLVVMGTYTGLAPDMSTGLSLGVKLPTGDDKGPNGPLGGAAFDRDTLPGTGSTDLVLGAYHIGKLTTDGKLSWFAQARYQLAVATRDHYRPGNGFNSTVGLAYKLGPYGRLSSVTPLLQLINSSREHDTGDNSDPLNSGYERLLISPGIEIRSGRVKFRADVALPLYQHVNSAASLDVADSLGQLVAPALIKAQVTYGF